MMGRFLCRIGIHKGKTPANGYWECARGCGKSIYFLAVSSIPQPPAKSTMENLPEAYE